MNSALPSLLAGLALPFTLPYPPVLMLDVTHTHCGIDWNHRIRMKLECSFDVYSHGVDLFIEDPYLAPLVGVGCPHAGRADLVKLEHVGILVPGAQVAAPVEISQSCSN